MNEEMNKGAEGAPVEEWKEELLIERTKLIEKCLNLNDYMNNNENKLSYVEWKLLEDQFEHMKAYCRVLTRRCQIYGLISTASLDLY